MKGQRGKSTLAAGPQQPRSTSGIKPPLTFGPRRILNNSEQKIALKTIFCAKPLAKAKAWLSGWLEGWRVHRDLLHLQRPLAPHLAELLEQ